MTFLPVVERELRVASRRRGTYWGRFTAGLIGAVLAAWTLLALAKQGEKIVGGFLFVVVSSVIFLYATVAGTLVTCDCLSEEKREGTLGLLFLTDLKGRDVVLGKLAATSIHAFYRLLAFLPMLAIPFILGGVTRAEMLRVVLVAINLLFFFLSLGLFVSAICRKDNWALGLAIIIGLALALGGPVMTQFNHFPYPQVALISSPATGCFLAFDSNYAASPLSLINLPGCFWGNAALTHIYGWIFFGLACWFVPRSWQDAAVGRKMPSSLATPPARRARIRLELLEINPFLWRVARSGRKSLLVWLTMFVLVALWLAYVRWLSLDYLEPGLDVLILVQAGLVLKAWLAVEASRTFSEDYHSGGLELLLSTPLQEKDIVRGQCMALWRQFGPPVIAVLLAHLFFMILLVRRWQFQERAYWLVIHVILGGFLVGDMMALSWVGMWLGLIHRKPNRAALQALLRILVLPPVIFVVLISLVRNPPVAAAYTLWAFLGLGANLCFALQARTKLRSQFRTIVSEGVARKPPVEPVPGTAAILMETP
jgi:ABC-type transport system involved in multi-copper enzyme maturation permease subunit